VFTFQFMEPANRQGVQMLVPGVSDFHGLSHHPPSDPGLQVVMSETMKALRVFVETLRALPEGGGNLLDSSAIMVANDVSEGATHAISDFPLLVVGRAGGLRSGVHYRSTTKENALKVPLTLARAVGASFADFGVGQGLTTESLSAIGG
jgi:hypothetical protein